MEASRYAADVLLDDGGLVHVRAIRPDDKQRLLEGFRGLSERSVYYRFFSLKRNLSAAELKYLTEVDFVQHVALVATIRPSAPIHQWTFEIGDLSVEGAADPAGASGGAVETDETDDEEIIGVGRYVVQGPGRAEVAIAVGDAHQRRGIGSVLLRHLVIIARAAGITAFEADVLAEKQAQHQAFLARGGFQPTMTPAGETVHLQFSIL